MYTDSTSPYFSVRVTWITCINVVNETGGPIKLKFGQHKVGGEADIGLGHGTSVNLSAAYVTDKAIQAALTGKAGHGSLALGGIDKDVAGSSVDLVGGLSLFWQLSAALEPGGAAARLQVVADYSFTHTLSAEVSVLATAKFTPKSWIIPKPEYKGGAFQSLRVAAIDLEDGPQYVLVWQQRLVVNPA